MKSFLNNVGKFYATNTKIILAAFGFLGFLFFYWIHHFTSNNFDVLILWWTFLSILLYAEETRQMRFQDSEKIKQNSTDKVIKVEIINNEIKKEKN